MSSSPSDSAIGAEPPHPTEPAIEPVPAALDRVSVAVPGPFPRPLTWSVPEALRGRLQRGHAVLVPLGRRHITGWVVEADPALPEGSKAPRLKPVAQLLDDEAVLPEPLLKLLERVASYYLHPVGEVLKTALPGAERTETRARYALSERGSARLRELQSDTHGGAAVQAEAFGGPPPAPSPERLVLEALASGSLRRQVLLKRLREAEHPKPGRWLTRLEKEGHVLREQTEDRRRRKRRQIAWVRLAVPLGDALAAFPRSGAVRERLLLHLARRGEVPRVELASEFPGAARILGQLATKQLIHEELRDPEQPASAATVFGEAASRPTPNPHQQTAVDAVLPYIDAAGTDSGYGAFLLEGVTGSGKTEVYLRLAERALERGGGVLVLVPEIALTPQLESRFRSRLGENLALLHSGMTNAERHEAWWRLRRGLARVAIGVRSSVFAPVPNLSLIVVDEEHDESYKQDDGLRYNARDVAVLRARIEGVPVVMGSATVSLESWANREAGRYEHLVLPERVGGRPMPVVERVGLEAVGTKGKEAGRWLSNPLLEAIGSTLDAGEQCIVLLNRRGFATFVVCGGCGQPFRCPDCDAGLVFHARSNRLRCHLCGWWRDFPETCPNCTSPELVLAGRGTERIEDELAARFPLARVDRMDRDTTRRRGSHAEILERFRKREVDLLVGTQMLAKGHDLPGVTLVGVVHADAGLGLPDFRAPERTFQLLCQVAGRAGRGERPGRVIFQALRPDHPVLLAAAQQDADAFRAYELPRRRMAAWPPNNRLALLRLDDSEPQRLRQAGSELAQALRDALPTGGRVLGPLPPLVGKVAGRHHLQILLRCPDRAGLRRCLLASGAWKPRGYAPVRVSIDIDPMRLT